MEFGPSRLSFTHDYYPIRYPTSTQVMIRLLAVHPVICTRNTLFPLAFVAISRSGVVPRFAPSFFTRATGFIGRLIFFKTIFLL